MNQGSPARDSSSMMMMSTEQKHGTVEGTEAPEKIIEQERENIRQDIKNWSKINNESPDFKRENWHPYTIVNDQEEAQELYETDIKKAKHVDITKVFERYLLYFKKVYFGSEND